MTHNSPILRHIHRLLSGPGHELPDRELLQRYLEKAEEAAFAKLVDRHGPMVLGVCQAVLHHPQDAEDAFQATFLVLARKASSIRRRDGLGSWLHGVAYRIARKARAKGARREVVEANAAVAEGQVGPADELSWGEVRALLHAELTALPGCFREPLVLCYLQGLTQDEAAGRLGCTRATVKGRLQRGRRLLRQRLERRGLGLGGALAATVLADQALAAPVPVALAAAILRAVGPGAGETASNAVIALARDGLGPLVPGKFKAIALGIILAVSVTGGAALVSQKPADAEQAAEPRPDAGQHAVRNDAYGDPLPEGAVARLGTIRFNHGDGLNSIFFSPDRKTIISEGNGSLRLWDATTGKEQRRFATAKPSFDDQTVLSADGKTLFLLNQDFKDDTLRVWDLEQGKEVRTLSFPIRRNISSIYIRNALAPDGRLCAIHTPEGIRVFETETGKELWQLSFDDEIQPGIQFAKAEDEIRTLVFAGNDQLVMADSQKQRVSVWEARTLKRVRQFAHGGPVREIAASPDGRRLATLEHHTNAIDRLLDKDLIHLWDLTTGIRQHKLPARPKRWYMHMRFAPDGKHLLASSYGDEGYELTIWDVAKGERIRELNGAVGEALAVSPDGGRLVEGAMSGKFELWDLKTGRHLHGENDHARAAAVFLSPRGDRATTIGFSSISAWDARAGRRLQTFDVPPYTLSDPEHIFSPDGRYALTFAGDSKQLQILVWDLAARRCVQTLRLRDGNTYVASAFSPNSSLLATWQAGKESVLLWDLRTGKEVRSIQVTKSDWGARLFFTADRKTLIVAGWCVAGFDLANGKELFSWRMAPLPSNGSEDVVVGGKPITDDDRIAWRTLTVSPDGVTAACILSGGVLSTERVENRIVLCEAQTGQIIRRWSDSGKPSRSFEPLAFSPDGRLLASADGFTVRLWEVATGKEVARFEGHQGEIHSLAFSDNGRRLASASTDSTVLIWNVAIGSDRQEKGEAGRDELNRWWADLASEDARNAYAAVWLFTEVPEAATAFLAQHLRPTTNADVKRISQLVDELDSDVFAVREKASQELKTMDVKAASMLRTALKNGASLEMRRRIEQLLNNLRNHPIAGEPIRSLRALTVLEQIGTPEARRLLRTLADGASGAWLTLEAKAACERLDRSRVSRD
jgi:RNA polymerase sigma factor (sigma-70 family)